VADILDDIGGDDVSVDEAEKRLAASGPIVPGFYRAKLDGATGFAPDGGVVRAHDLTFLILGGPFDGRKVNDKLWLVKEEDKDATDDETVKKVGNTRARLTKFGIVLGLLVKDQQGKARKKDPNKGDFIDVIDAECIIRVTLEADKNNPDKKWPRLAFDGIFAKDDREAAAKIGKPPAPPKGGSGTAPPAEAKKPPAVAGVKGKI
jgi:hypothetical protein